MSHLHGSQEHHHLPVGHFPRNLMDFENFFGQSLDVFDPFDELDLASHQMQSALQWLQDPPRLQQELCPVTGHKKRAHSDKFRVTLDVTGFKPEDLSVKVVGRKLFINGKQEFRDGEDFSVKEMRKTYDLPENASFEHMTSFLTKKGTLVVEFPLITLAKERDDHRHQLEKYGANVKEFNFDEFFKSAFEPKISDDADKKGGKKIDLSLDMTGFRPDQIQIHLKDHDLIVQAESSASDKHHTARSYIYKAVTLPPNIDIEHMRSFLHDGKRLVISAPYNENVATISNGKNGGGDHYVDLSKIGDDFKIRQCASPTSSTCSIAGSVNSTFGSTR